MKYLCACLLAFVALGVTGSGCASAEESDVMLPDASDPPGSCDPKYCPNPANGAGKGCCLTANGPCGFDFGAMCVASPKDGG